MGRGSGGYVNLLSHSPVNTPCPSYRFRDFDFLDDTVGAIQSERSDPTDILCPVQIHVEPNAENVDIVGTSTGKIHEVERDLLDLDSDNDHALRKSYILINDCQSNDTSPKKIPYPDANSHSNYNLLTEDTRSFESWSRNLRSSYPIANSHINVFQDTNSHSKYDVLSDYNSDKNGGTSYDDGSSYSMANSHGIYRLLSDSSDRTGENLSRENLIPPDEANYEIANSHSNYQIFYNSQTRYDIEVASARKGFSRRSPMTVEDYESLQQMVGPWTKRTDPGTTSPVSESSHSSKSTEETSTTCDIEECLIQIEESLLNIEQNLLHVQDLDIPELKNLLYKSPSIERSLFEVQDLLCSGNIESVKRDTLFSSCNDHDKVELTDESTSKEDSPDSDHDTFTNDDENLLQFTDDRSTSEENFASVTRATSNAIFYGSVDRNVNFIANSLSKSPPTKIGFDLIEDNIKAYRSNDRCDRNDDLTIDNLNNEVVEKLMSRKKCHSRTNSLDDNSIFQSVSLGKPRKTSLENLFYEGNDNYLEINEKARSEDALEQRDDETFFERKRKSSGHPRSRSKEDDRLVEVETKAEEFRKKIENIISSRRSALPNLENSVKTTRNSREPLENRSNSLERSPRPRKASADKLYDKDSSPTNKAFKSSSYEKRKRKKPNRTQSSENALVPSKLISLSLSLLLAALLQAVRCLTDLVEDAFRSVSYDRSGLLE